MPDEQMLYFVSLLPILLYVIAIKSMDAFKLASWKKVILAAGWGMLDCTALFLAASTGESSSNEWSPLLEELLKGLPLVYLIGRKRIAFLAEALIYGTAIGAGFALLENIIYVTVISDLSLYGAALRVFGTVVLHIGCTFLFGASAVMMMRIFSALPPIIYWLCCLVPVIPPAVIHFCFNLFLLPESVRVVLTVVLMSAMFVIIYEIDSRFVHKWLDSCISNDISLLASIREGRFRETAAGRYLSQAQKKYDPETFFDICNYVGLYLELSVAAKSRMILREAGIEMPYSEKTHGENLNKLSELRSLESNLGLTVRMFLKPITNEINADSWVLKELL